MSLCKECERPLKIDEIGLTLKLVSRAATEAYCMDCLSKRLKVSQDWLLAVIETYRRQGCMLFEPLREDEKRG